MMHRLAQLLGVAVRILGESRWSAPEGPRRNSASIHCPSTSALASKCAALWKTIRLRRRWLKTVTRTPNRSVAPEFWTRSAERVVGRCDVGLAPPPRRRGFGAEGA